MYAAVAEDRKFFAETDFIDFDRGKEIWFLGSVEDVGQGGENGIVVVGVGAELGDRLGNEHVEPVQTLRLMRVDVVVRLAQDRCCGESGRWA